MSAIPAPNRIILGASRMEVQVTNTDVLFHWSHDEEVFDGILMLASFVHKPKVNHVSIIALERPCTHGTVSLKAKIDQIKARSGPVASIYVAPIGGSIIGDVEQLRTLCVRIKSFCKYMYLHDFTASATTPSTRKLPPRKVSAPAKTRSMPSLIPTSPRLVSTNGNGHGNNIPLPVAPRARGTLSSVLPFLSMRKRIPRPPPIEGNGH